MPWKETYAMEERIKFIGRYLEEESSLIELSEEFGISRKTAHKWVVRYRDQGPEGLVERSHAPRRCWNQTEEDIERRIVTLREKHRRWGPKKLIHRLERLEPEIGWPSVSTAGAILKRHGLVACRKLRRKTPKYLGERKEAWRPNEVWTADFKGQLVTADGRRVDPLTIADLSSRYLLKCEAVKSMGTETIKSEFEETFREYGLPSAIRTDNGSPFASMGLGGLTRLSVWWIRLGIMPERIRPGHPEENGSHERMHRSLSEDTAQPPATNVPAQQGAFRRFRQEYNQERPHEALGMRVPAELYEKSERQFPVKVPEPEYASGFKSRRLNSKGYMHWLGEIIYLSEALTCQRVGIKEVGEEAWQINFGPMALALYDGRKKTLKRLGDDRKPRKV